ncbi:MULTISPECIES: Dps family protein [unclassified Deinococcus]|uniref:Dps family protein n=1 Tax=unclassified Deinococcus TaxID=2623546 RepID=UPI0006DD1D7F|nr:MULTISPECIES: DNA starvation/stationary phase protection protein [unclassified Deinococcus]MCD0168197.1 DNA starvation/stationary phase protection protein [Deinococcus sp. 23YEL01]PIG98244.1 DNA starvation/stationary phase protection protein [Deinococcus sp. UR1]
MSLTTTAPLTVPRPLATPTDLTAEGTAQITAALNALAADAVALYLKTKNYHWHLSGPHFRDYHLMFGEQAGQLLASVDVLAERVRRLGGTTLRSTGHVLRLQRVTDDDGDFVTAPDMLARLLAENGAMAARQRDAHEVCDRQRDYATASLLEVFIDETEWRSWFLFEAMQGDAGR